MAIPPGPMPPPAGGAPAGMPPKPPGGGGIGLPGSPIGGPSGPGASPTLSPGTGAGMQARASAGIMKVIETLMEYASAWQPGTPEFNGLMGAIRNLNQVAKTSKTGDAAAGKTPLPIPPTPPGAGVGGVGAPPSGLTPPGGNAGGPPGGGAGPIEPAA